MSAKDRASLITKLYKYVKKEYRLHPIPSDRNVLEHMLYACCLEDATYEAADEAFAKLQANYFDWNEVRVTTVTELAEVCKRVTNPVECATRIKKALYGVFENYYQFDIDFLKKENLGRAVMQMSKFKDMSPFVVAYVAQIGLGGHSIPLDNSRLLLFEVLGIASKADVEARKIPGLERVIPKNKGVEFSGLLHYLAVEFGKSPHNKDVRAKLLKLAPDAAERFPKRISKKKRLEMEAAAAAAEAAAKKAEREAAKATQKDSKQKPDKKKPTKKAAAAAAKAAKVAKEKAAKEKATKAKAAKSAKAAKAKPAKKAAKKATKKKASKKAPAKKTKASKKASSKKLKKKKPR